MGYMLNVEETGVVAGDHYAAVQANCDNTPSAKQEQDPENMPFEEPSPADAEEGERSNVDPGGF